MDIDEERSFQLEFEVEAALRTVLEQLQTNEIICRYQKIEQRIANNSNIQQLVEEIKKSQKEAVAFEHYEKPEARKAAIEKADQLTEALERHLLVVEYRESLLETNELLQHMTKLLEGRVNDLLEAGLGNKEI